MQRIDEGLIILRELHATEAAMRTFCLHPLFQSDEDLVHYGQDYMNNVDADPRDPAGHGIPQQGECLARRQGATRA